METARYKILLIEDDKIDQEAFKRMVQEKQLPYDCTVAGSVSEAQGILVSKNFDVVISDYSLRDGTAFDILDSAKDTPTIFVTGAGNEEIAVKAWKAGAYDYLIKDSGHDYLDMLPVRAKNAIEQKKTKEKLRKFNRLKSELAVAVSHELRTSLCIVKSVIFHAVAGLMGPINDKLRKNLEIGEKTIDSLEKTINDFLDISKIETGEIQPRKTKIDMQEIVSEAIFLLTGLAVEKGIKLVAAFPPDPGFDVYADHGLVRQILINLIDNAIKLSPKGGTIRITIKNLEDEVQIEAQELSTGIGSDDISKVFNRFLQIDDYDSSKINESSLGVYIAKQLVVAHGGRIWAESTPEKGDIFGFTLPKLAVQQTTAPITLGR